MKLKLIQGKLGTKYYFYVSQHLIITYMSNYIRQGERRTENQEQFDNLADVVVVIYNGLSKLASNKKVKCETKESTAYKVYIRKVIKRANKLSKM